MFKIYIVFILQHQFGDLLTFPHGAGAYDHYAVYVGNERLEGKTDEQDIFEMTRKCPFTLSLPTLCLHLLFTISLAYVYVNQGVLPVSPAGVPNACHFGTIGTRKPITKNKPHLPKKSKEEIIQTITDLSKTNCLDQYDLFSNNCEHIATYIVYGEKICDQVKIKICCL